MKRLKHVLYAFFVLCIIAATVMFYKAWWNRYFSLRPDFVAAEAGVAANEFPVTGLFLWRETVLTAPADGAVTFPAGGGPFYAAKGDKLAVVSWSSGSRVLKAPDTGYFIAALDGMEGRIEYSDLWSGADRLPVASDPVFIADGSSVKKGQAIGRFVLQPSDLRLLAWVDVSATLKRHVDDGFVRLKFLPDSFPFEAEVRAVRYFGAKAKLYLSLPFFPPEILESRNAVFSLFLGDHRGVTVPETAVVLKDRRQMVFVVEGDRIKGRTVEGFTFSKNRFLVLQGLKPGELVIVNGAGVKEGEIRIW